MQALPAPPGTRRFPVGKFLVSLAVAGCLAGIAWGVSLGDTSVRKIGKHVERVEPEDASPVVPGQASVVADLESGWEGELSIDGRRIPKDQVQFTRATAVISFTPGIGKDIERLAGGPHTATVIYWMTGEDPAGALRASWTFRVV
jgi:hypothetical protein